MKKNKEDRPDTSPKVIQREKIKDPFTIREFNWTEKQKNFIEIALRKETKIVFCQSPPGTGKTLLSLFCCLLKLKDKKVGQILYVRNPIESASRGIGWVPGDQNMKMDWVCQPLYDHMSELLTKDIIAKLNNENRIEGIPLGYAKGRTYHNCGIILDEAEDLNAQELMLVMGRVGKFSTLFVIGDYRQSNVRNSGFEKVFNLFNNVESQARGIHCLSFTKEDIMRNEFLSFVIEKFETLT